jgi:hypothetical protein
MEVSFSITSLFIGLILGAFWVCFVFLLAGQTR